MPLIKTRKYIAKPSDSTKWVIIKSPKAELEVDCELRIMNYLYDCVPKLVTIGDQQVYCSQLCCYTGCYITPKEIKFTETILPGLKPMLQPDALKLIEQTHDQIHLPDDYDPKEDLYKTRCSPEEWKVAEPPEEGSETTSEPSSEPSPETAPRISQDKSSETEGEKKSDTGDSEPNEEVTINSQTQENPTPMDPELNPGPSHPPENHCLFLMANGLCSIHKYCNDNKLNWVKEKYNICVTFPLDIRPQDNTLAFMSGFDHFTFGDVVCISPDEERKATLNMPQVIVSMKYAIVDRFGEEFWEALNTFAEDFRKERIDLKYLNRELNNS